MTRRPRSIQDGEIYHVYARGNGRSAIYFEDGHRRYFLRRLGEILPGSGTEILAYCLMDNHFHLIVRAGWRPLGRPMQRLLSGYARRINREAGRQGHLFERRYQAVHVPNDAYARTLLRYVHLNPARAGIVDDPLDYPWSSHRPYHGEPGPEWLKTGPLLSLFGECGDTARLRFQHYCAGTHALAAAPPVIRQKRARTASPSKSAEQRSVSSQISCGGKYPHSVDDIVGLVAAICGLPHHLVLTGRDHEAAQARGLVARAIQEIPELLLSDLGRLTHRHVSTLSNAGRRAAARCDKVPKYAEQWGSLTRALNLAKSSELR